MQNMKKIKLLIKNIKWLMRNDVSEINKVVIRGDDLLDSIQRSTKAGYRWTAHTGKIEMNELT